MTSERNRVEVLSRVRVALGTTGSDAARKQAVAARLGKHQRGTIPAIARGDRETLRQRFTSMLASQGAQVVQAAKPEDAVAAIASELAEHELEPRLRLGADFLLAALPWHAAPSLELCFGRADPNDRAGLSRAAVGAAETGTLFLLSGPDNPTTLAFLPEQHVVLIRDADIVGSYEEAFDRLREAHGEGHLPRSLNLISGPSRTADIEQTIVRGAHGPKHLLVVLLA